MKSVKHRTESLAALIRTHGIILATERYEACLTFYRDTLELPVWFEKEQLCCLRFGDGYLMIETGGMARDRYKPNSENPTMLRFNVADVEAAAAILEARGIRVELKRFDWGTVGTFADPDGNACELKDAGDPFFAGTPIPG
jgi:lactoylglutathione lyase